MKRRALLTSAAATVLPPLVPPLARVPHYPRRRAELYERAQRYLDAGTYTTLDEALHAALLGDPELFNGAHHAEVCPAFDRHAFDCWLEKMGLV